MQEAHVTPLPESFVKPQKKFHPLKTLLIVLFIVALAGVLYVVFNKNNKKLKRLFKKVEFACPVPQKYCKKGYPLYTFNEGEKRDFYVLMYVLPEGVPILASKENTKYTATNSKITNQPLFLENQTMIIGIYKDSRNTYQIGYLFGGVAKGTGKTVNVGEPIGIVQGKTGIKNNKPNLKNQYTFVFFVKDVVNKDYLKLKPSSDGKIVEGQ